METSGNIDLPTQTAREALHVRRVFGEPYERDGVTVIPVAKVMGGSGMGFGSESAGEDEPATGAAATGPGAHGPAHAGEGSGGGGGFAVRARPVGVYVIKDGAVSWQPALDLNRVILSGQLLGVVVVLALSWALRRRG
ncbi:spore germination protein GerW family protein [Georgenia sp. AZ-5]|uniref:spore germination protein GerW family protein n=1 Tax=Georgenia sp. AZ-5 TaxID=3367526 RepID=UPI003753E9F1